MLSRSAPSTASGQGMRLCSICDGIDAVLLVAAYFSQFRSEAGRTDLSMAEALEHLQLHRDDRFDRIVLAPNAARTAAPLMLQALVEEARRHSDDVVLLLPHKSRLAIPAETGAGLRILHGPPFDDADTARESDGTDDQIPPDEAPPETSPASLWKRLIPWKERPSQGAAAKPPPAPELPSGLKSVMILPVCGGAGGTTLAVNLAVEAARARPDRSVCLIDLNLQYGNVATYTGLPANTRIVDAYRGIESLDQDAFEMCLQNAAANLHVFPGPGEILPADGITAEHLRRIVSLARGKADLVIVDLPHQVADWSGAAFEEASALLAVATLDVRSAQNLAKLRELMRSENLASGKLLCLLNRAAARRSHMWEEARAQFEKGNGTGLFRILPDGGGAVAMACNAGVPLVEHAPGNPLRMAIREIAAELVAQTEPRP
ncbi:AAA family ATPase [Pseudogemmobacter sonorensis]|uniref:AAA family ATPase n=1 Tax=Pseudogemmobacter sonorensis TaxID=2989681 RepID=UPI0036D02781